MLVLFWLFPEEDWVPVSMNKAAGFMVGKYSSGKFGVGIGSISVSLRGSIWGGSGIGKVSFSVSFSEELVVGIHVSSQSGGPLGR